jgi:hypothetical protein
MIDSGMARRRRHHAPAGRFYLKGVHLVRSAEIESYGRSLLTETAFNGEIACASKPASS